jgi:hypothetical protein
MADSAECWQNITSKVSRKIFSYLPMVKDTLGLRMSGIYSIPCECAGFILDKADDPSRSESKSTTDIQDWHKLTNQQ